VSQLHWGQHAAWRDEPGEPGSCSAHARQPSSRRAARFLLFPRAAGRRLGLRLLRIWPRAGVPRLQGRASITIQDSLPRTRRCAWCTAPAGRRGRASDFSYSSDTLQVRMCASSTRRGMSGCRLPWSSTSPRKSQTRFPPCACQTSDERYLPWPLAAEAHCYCNEEQCVHHCAFEWGAHLLTAMRR